MYDIFWMVIGHSGTFYCGIQPPQHGNVWYTYIFLCFTPACVWCCDASTFTEHENHQTSNLNMKYSGEHDKRQCPDHRHTFAANRQRSQARATPPDVNCFLPHQVFAGRADRVFSIDGRRNLNSCITSQIHDLLALLPAAVLTTFTVTGVRFSE